MIDKNVNFNDTFKYLMSFNKIFIDNGHNSQTNPNIYLFLFLSISTNRQESFSKRTTVRWGKHFFEEDSFKSFSQQSQKLIKSSDKKEKERERERETTFIKL